MTPQELKNSILQLAIQGKLVEQRAEEGTGRELLEKILAAKNAKDAEKGKGKGRLTRSRGDRGDAPTSASSASPRDEIPDDEKPFDIPDSWEWVRLGDIFAHNTGKAMNSSARAANKSGSCRRFLTTSNLYWNSFDFSKVKEMFFSDDELDRYTVKKRDILVCEGGAYYGRPAIWDFDYDICIQNHIHRLRAYKKVVEEYFYYLLRFLRETGMMKSQGTAMPGLSSSALHNLVIPLPPLAEQKRIVAKIEELLPLIDRYEKAWSRLESFNKSFPVDMQKSILQMAIQGKLVEQRAEEGTGRELLGKILAAKNAEGAKGRGGTSHAKSAKSAKAESRVSREEIPDDEKPFDIPENWEWVRLGDIVEIYTGKRDANFGSSEGEYDFFTCSNQPIKCSSYSYDGEFLIMPGNGANIGMVIHYKGKFEAYQRTYLLENRFGVFMDYLECHLKANWKQYNADKMYGSAIPYIKLGNLTNYLVAIPPLAEQKRIVAKLEELLPLCERLK